MILGGNFNRARVTGSRNPGVLGEELSVHEIAAGPHHWNTLAESFVGTCETNFLEWRPQMADTPRSDFNQAGNKAQNTVGDLADKAKGAVDSASSVASQTISNVEDAGKQAWDIGQKFGTQAKDQAQEMAGQVSEQASRALQALTRQIHAEPILSIAVAGAIGYFLGIVSHRR
jgi:ElaB/YqjD/DUF883 family membrane-anchored ribosome-binding protein